MSRIQRTTRATRETTIECCLDFDNNAPCNIQTGIGFLDHMLITFATHAMLGIELQCKGDLHVDDHHLVEDTALTLGNTINMILADKKGITRFGFAYAPMDEALSRCVIDLSGRPYTSIDLGLKRESIGTMACENVTHFFESFAMSLKASLHIDVLKGQNDHHRIESAFKAFAIAFRQATALSNCTTIPSTKGVL